MRVLVELAVMILVLVGLPLDIKMHGICLCSLLIVMPVFRIYDRASIKPAKPFSGKCWKECLLKMLCVVCLCVSELVQNHVGSRMLQPTAEHSPGLLHTAIDSRPTSILST